MTHIEGVLKDFVIDDVGETVIFTLKGYDGKEYRGGFSVKEFLEKVIKNEKAGIILYPDCDTDYISIRGVVKSLELTATYSNNF